MASIQKTLAIAFMAASMGGCATVSRAPSPEDMAYRAAQDEEAQSRQIAESLIQSENPFFQAIGLSTLRRLNNAVDEAAGKMGKCLIVNDTELQNGNRLLKCIKIRFVPQGS